MFSDKDDSTEATEPPSEEMRYITGVEKDQQNQQEPMEALQTKTEEFGERLDLSDDNTGIDTEGGSTPLNIPHGSGTSNYTAPRNAGGGRKRHEPVDTSAFGRTIVLVFFLLCMFLVTFILPLMFRHKLEERGNRTPIDIHRMEEIKAVIEESRITSRERLEDEGSDAYFALRWLTHADQAQLKPVLPNNAYNTMEGRDGEILDITNTELLQRYAMAVLYYATHTSVDPETHSLGKVVEVSANDHDDISTSDSKEVAAEDLSTQEKLKPVVVHLSRDQHGRQRREAKATRATSGWTREDGWMSSISICEWYGIECQDSIPKQVVHLNLTANSLKGTIPSELQALTRLVLMDISHNNLSGEIPGRLMNHLPLNYFMVNHNHLIGSIPYSVSQLKTIQEFDLSYNQMKGTILPSIGSLSQMRQLNLESNRFSGAIPSLGTLSELYTLKLGSNHFDGSLPIDVTFLKKLVTLGLQNNTLSGTFPPKIGSMQYLRSLDLSENNFEGEIPDIFSRLKELEDLNLARNKFSSELPPSIGALTNLKNLLLSSNELIGPIPDDWANLTSLERLALDHNKINGTIPLHVLDNMSKLHCLRLSYNDMEGTIPVYLGALTNLMNVTLESNRFSGTIPAELADVTTLEVLQLDHNDLSGAVPAAFCDLKTNSHLEYLSVDCGEVECDCCDNCFRLFG